MATPSASYSFTMRLKLANQAKAFSNVAVAIDEAGGMVGAIDIARSSRAVTWRDVTVSASDSEHAQRIVDAVARVDGVVVEAVSDRTFLMHLGGKMAISLKFPINTRDDLSMAYTPGVGRICTAIADNRDAAWALTIKRNTVAVVSDGSAVLGLGDIGPEAAMPVMEGKAVLFKRFADIDAWPICLDVHTADEIVNAVKAIAPGFGGINLEDIASPACFEIEERLRNELDIPVFHDDQHGTAVVVLAALLNAAHVVNKNIADLKIVVLGIGAAGIAVSRMLLGAGARDVIGVDRHGVLHHDRTEGMNGAKAAFAEKTNPRNVTGTLSDALVDADVFIGLSGPAAVKAEQIALMSNDAIVFAMANPIPEILPEEVPDNVRIMATGRSDYPNQINNVLAFPGIFRGALDVHASEIDEPMKIAAARAIADVIPIDEVHEEYIIPSVFNKAVSINVARAVAEAARNSGRARRTPQNPEVIKIPNGEN